MASDQAAAQRRLDQAQGRFLDMLSVFDPRLLPGAQVLIASEANVPIKHRVMYTVMMAMDVEDARCAGFRERNGQPAITVPLPKAVPPITAGMAAIIIAVHGLIGCTDTGAWGVLVRAFNPPRGTDPAAVGDAFGHFSAQIYELESLTGRSMHKRLSEIIRGLDSAESTAKMLEGAVVSRHASTMSNGDTSFLFLTLGQGGAYSQRRFSELISRCMLPSARAAIQRAMIDDEVALGAMIFVHIMLYVAASMGRSIDYFHAMHEMGLTVNKQGFWRRGDAKADKKERAAATLADAAGLCSTSRFNAVEVTRAFFKNVHSALGLLFYKAPGGGAAGQPAPGVGPDGEVYLGEALRVVPWSGTSNAFAPFDATRQVDPPPYEVLPQLISSRRVNSNLTTVHGVPGATGAALLIPVGQGKFEHLVHVRDGEFHGMNMYVGQLANRPGNPAVSVRISPADAANGRIIPVASDEPPLGPSGVLTYLSRSARLGTEMRVVGFTADQTGSPLSAFLASMMRDIGLYLTTVRLQMLNRARASAEGAIVQDLYLHFKRGEYLPLDFSAAAVSMVTGERFAQPDTRVNYPVDCLAQHLSLRTCYVLGWEDDGGESETDAKLTFTPHLVSAAAAAPQADLRHSTILLERLTAFAASLFVADTIRHFTSRSAGPRHDAAVHAVQREWSFELESTSDMVSQVLADFMSSSAVLSTEALLHQLVTYGIARIADGSLPRAADSHVRILSLLMKRLESVPQSYFAP